MTKLDDMLDEVEATLKIYADADAGVEQLLAGFNATPDMRDENSPAERMLVKFQAWRDGV